MTSSTVAVFFAVLLLGGTIGTLAALATPSSRRSLAESGTSLAAILAVGATLGSLYFSEIAHYAPCELCWYQRIAMYPLAVLIPLAMVRRDRSILPYVRILAVIGIVIGLYHAQLQAFPDQGSFCDVTNPCTSSPVKALGFMTIPHMSILSFAGIIVMTTLAISTPHEGDLPT